MVRKGAVDVRVCMVGLGYVGLPLAIKLAEHFKVVGFDINKRRVADISRGFDKNLEVSAAEFKKVEKNIEYTSDESRIRWADFVIVGVPTPVSVDKRPDLSFLESASRIVGRNLRKGAVVVYESTVYPGCTEEFCLPILEEESGMRLGDFFIGYSPERVNPGDKEHSLGRVFKIVAGCTDEVTERLAGVYGRVTEVYRARSIRTAEAAKVIENVQRDINIALFNELAMLFDAMALDSKEVFDAAATKWNFLRFHPGLVGGHCIPVDPYYLAQRALEFGHMPELILAGRRVNEGLAGYIAQKAVKLLIKTGKPLKDVRILILGATYKEDVPDLRDSKIEDLVKELSGFGLENISLYEPMLQDRRLFGVVNKKPVGRYDVVVYAVKHRAFAGLDVFKLLERGGILIDVKRLFDKADVVSKGFAYWGL